VILTNLNLILLSLKIFSSLLEQVNISICLSFDIFEIHSKAFFNLVSSKYTNDSSNTNGTSIQLSNAEILKAKYNSSIVPTPFKSPKELYETGGLDLIEEDLKNKNKLLEELGINLNLALVTDVADENSFIFNRTISSDVNIVSEYTNRVINTSKLSKVSYVLKHFPGYGNNLDTHKELSIDERTIDEFRNKDFIPFKRGIEEKAECILVNHNIIKNIEDNIPASLSKNIHNILRDELAFTGIIITDDLYMDAIKEYVDKPSIQAVNAGNDMIIITDYEQGILDIKEALNNGIINEETINTAVRRILAWKYYKGMIE
jgi:beta-N-acetylhexosaminidase